MIGEVAQARQDRVSVTRLTSNDVVITVGQEVLRMSLAEAWWLTVAGLPTVLEPEGP